ncbi:hypothetical protein Nepgr_004550 [Nepenthes gracilis]|uniref:Uncharacterized protein n=1 Tax=Nepenthes gracilis TaxID=150966 RepID=A0AAD3S1K8_NEPGR|nr:hypothetical protein Nepgr_004550 [Nepenthes gracilis]
MWALSNATYGQVWQHLQLLIRLLLGFLKDAAATGVIEKSRASSEVQAETGIEVYMETTEPSVSNVLEVVLESEAVVRSSEAEEVAIGVDTVELTKRLDSKAKKGESSSSGISPLSKVFIQNGLGSIISSFV